MCPCHKPLNPRAFTIALASPTTRSRSSPCPRAPYTPPRQAIHVLDLPHRFRTLVHSAVPHTLVAYFSASPPLGECWNSWASFCSGLYSRSCCLLQGVVSVSVHASSSFSVRSTSRLADLVSAKPTIGRCAAGDVDVVDSPESIALKIGFIHALCFTDHMCDPMRRG